MPKILDLIADWLGDNWGWIALAGVFVDISPIKFSPITGILRWIGHKLTGELREQIAALRADVDAQQKDQIRTTVLEFSNSLIYRTHHTKEEFDHILELDSKYHQLLKPGEKNSVYDSAIAFVRRVEAKCRDEGCYLQIPSVEKSAKESGGKGAKRSSASLGGTACRVPAGVSAPDHPDSGITANLTMSSEPAPLSAETGDQ